MTYAVQTPRFDEPDISSPRMEVLRAVVEVYERDGRATVRAVADAADRSVSTTHFLLRHLHRLGLVAWEDDKKGTLRPLIRGYVS